MEIKHLVWLAPLVAAACSDGKPVALPPGEAQLADYAGEWDGHAEAYAFPEEGSDRLRLMLDANGDGTLEIGDGDPLPLPTNPDDGPLVALDVSVLRDRFSYPVHATTVEGGRIHLGVDPRDIFASWCAIERPVAIRGGDGYSCAPVDQAVTRWDEPSDCRIGDPAGDESAIACARMSACLRGICTCTASACRVRQSPPDGPATAASYPAMLDGALDAQGTGLSGTLLLFASAAQANRTALDIQLRRR